MRISRQAEKKDRAAFAGCRVSGESGVAHLVSRIAKRTALMRLDFGAGLPSAGESPRGGDHGDAAPIGRHLKVDDRQGRPTCPHATIELEQALGIEWHKAAGIWREFATLFPVPLGAKNACNWAIHGCICASAEPAVMSVVVISRPTVTRRSIFMQPTTRSSKPMIRPKAGAGVTLTKSCLTCRIGRRRKQVRSRDFFDAIRRCRWAVKAWAMPAYARPTDGA